MDRLLVWAGEYLVICDDIFTSVLEFFRTFALKILVVWLEKKQNNTRVLVKKVETMFKKVRIHMIKQSSNGRKCLIICRYRSMGLATVQSREHIVRMKQ